MENLMRLEKPGHNLPVAFASNTLYVLARNGLAHDSGQLIRQRLVPALLKKQTYLHGEGVAQAVYALEKANYFNEEVWQMLKAKIQTAEFDYLLVKPAKGQFDSHFYKLRGDEHVAQALLDPFANELFFGDKLNLFELYNGLRGAHEKAPELGLDETVALIESRYANVLAHNEKYLELSEVVLPQF